MTETSATAQHPCDGCDGHECDDGCAYPGATSATAQLGSEPTVDEVATELYAAEYDRDHYPFAEQSSAEQLTYRCQARAILQNFKVSRRAALASQQGGEKAGDANIGSITAMYARWDRVREKAEASAQDAEGRRAPNSSTDRPTSPAPDASAHAQRLPE